MKYNSKKVLTIVITLFLIIGISGDIFAHSGRTDSNGGHKDNKNKSGLGSYHYHCGGYPAHLHNNGVCPYTVTSSSNKNESTLKSSDNKDVTASSSGKNTTTPADTRKSIVEATDIKINESITSIKVGESIKLTATITPENTEDKNITWLSSKEDLAIVSSSGKIVALKTGVVDITVTTSNGKNDTISIIVEEMENIEENNNAIESIGNNEVNNTDINTTESSDTISGVIGLGLIGGGCYLICKKSKK